MQEERWRFSGIDETNNGKFPVIYSAVFSNNSSDADEFPSLVFPKIRRNHRGLAAKLSNRHYSFLLLSQAEASNHSYHHLPGIVAASLVYQEKVSGTLEIFFDGEIFGQSPTPHIQYALDVIHEVTEIPKELISIHYGKDLDRRVKAVNLADEVAHWLLRKSLETLRENPRMKTLLRL